MKAAFKIKRKSYGGKLEKLDRRLLRLMRRMDKSGFYDYMLYINNTKRFILRNLLAGVSRGVGAAIGFSILGAVMLMILRSIAESSIPYIAEFVSRIIEIIDK